mgnify:CR=1 FL=1
MVIGGKKLFAVYSNYYDTCYDLYDMQQRKFVAHNTEKDWNWAPLPTAWTFPAVAHTAC